jgi:O-antigen ligase
MAIPFLLGLVTPIGEAYRYSELYGFSRPGFVGVFQNAHAASLAMGLGCVIALWRILVEQQMARLAIHCVLLGSLTLLTLETYARTGLAVALAGMCALLLRLGGKKSGRLIALASGGAAILIVLSPEYLTPMANRLLGETIYSADVDSRSVMDRASSGRLTFIVEGLTAWKEAGPSAWLFGLGYGGMEQELAKRVGYRIPTHNGFSDAIVANGLLGLAALIGLVWSLARDIRAHQEPRVRALASALYVSWLAFLLVQGGEMPLHFLLIVIPAATAGAAIRARRGLQP